MSVSDPHTARLYRRIETLRRQVDRIDERVLAAVAARLAVVAEIGELKAQLGLHTFQRSRWVAMSQRWKDGGARRGLERRFTARLLELVHDESLRVQRSRRRKRPGKKRP